MITTVPSNLGKGEVLYFVCPDSGKKCRILYCAYNSGIYKSRKSFQNRLYYNAQRVSQYSYNNTRYFAIEKELELLYKKQVKSHYKCKPTRLQKRILKLENDKRKFDYLRWTVIPQGVAKLLNTEKYKHFGKSDF